VHANASASRQPASSVSKVLLWLQPLLLKQHAQCMRTCACICARVRRCSNVAPACKPCHQRAALPKRNGLASTAQQRRRSCVHHKRCSKRSCISCSLCEAVLLAPPACGAPPVALEAQLCHAQLVLILAQAADEQRPAGVVEGNELIGHACA